MPSLEVSSYSHALTLRDSAHSIEASYFEAFIPPLLASTVLEVYSFSLEDVYTRLLLSFRAVVEHNSKGRTELRGTVAQN